MFFSDEKYARGQRSKQLCLLDTSLVKEIEEMKCKSDPIVLLQGAESQISLRAVNGCWAPDTMRMIAKISRKSLILLLYNSSTHNFLSKEVVKTLRIPYAVQGAVRVKVASGQPMISLIVCKQLPMHIQGMAFLEING